MEAQLTFHGTVCLARDFRQIVKLLGQIHWFNFSISILIFLHYYNRSVSTPDKPDHVNKKIRRVNKVHK